MKFKLKFNKAVFVFLLLDIFLIILASLFAFLLRFDGQIPPAKREGFLVFTVLAVFITILIFALLGIYRISWRYVSITDLPDIFVAVLLSAFSLGGFLFVLRNAKPFLEFPRSVIFLYPILLFLFVSCLRFSKRIYWQILKAKHPKQEEFYLPLTSSFVKEKGNLIKTILMTGGAGYLGSVLTRKLLQEGFKVKVLDKLLFGKDSLKDLEQNPNFQLIEGDILKVNEMKDIFLDVDVVINLAAIVGEAACLSNKEIAIKTNYLGSLYVARLCKSLGINRFIQASTCSTYGENKEDILLKEDSPLFPVDFYGETKIYAERELMKISDKEFSPTILRFSTLYGVSPRMRFDLAINSFVKKAIKDKEIFVFGGEQWRPFLSVNDAARAILLAIKAPLKKVGGEIFNVGANKENYRLIEVAELVKELIPGTDIKTISTIEDKRSYKVDFTKIEKVLNFSNQKTVKDGIVEIRDALKEGKFGDAEDKKYYNHLASF